MVTEPVGIIGIVGIHLRTDLTKGSARDWVRFVVGRRRARDVVDRAGAAFRKVRGAVAADGRSLAYDAGDGLRPFGKRVR